jgi:hypothetical protein
MAARVLVAISIAAACGFLTLPGAALPASAPPPSTVFEDAVGDAGAAPDIHTVTVSNDESAFYTFHVDLASVYDSASGVFVGIDSDNDPNTGDRSLLGSEYAIGATGADRHPAFFVWDGTTWQDGLIDSSIFVRPTVDRRGLNISVSGGDIGRSTSFTFFVLTFAFAVDASTFSLDLYADLAPDGDPWRYTYQQPFSVILASSRSKVNRAAHRWDITAAAIRSDTAGYVGAEATLGCSARAAGKKLAVLRRVIAPRGAQRTPTALCEFRTPKRRVSMSGTITISYNGALITKTFTARS